MPSGRAAKEVKDAPEELLVGEGSPPSPYSFKKLPPPRRQSQTRTRIDTDVSILPLDEAASIVFKRLQKKSTPRGVVGGGSDPLEVFRHLDATSCGTLSHELVVQALANIGLRANIEFVKAAVERYGTSNNSELVDYADFVEQLKERCGCKAWGVVRSKLSNLVLELGPDWGGGADAPRSVFLMPQASGNPGQQWRLTSSGNLECKEDATRASGPFVLSIEGADRGDLSGEGSDSSSDVRKSKYVVASRLLVSGGRLLDSDAADAQRWRRNEASEELFSCLHGQYLTVKGGVKTMDAKLWVNSCKNSAAQKFAFEPTVEVDDSNGGTLEPEVDSHNPLMGSAF